MWARSLAAPALMALLSPAMGGDIAFVTSQNGDEVAILDLDLTRIIARIPLEGAPAPVAYDPAAGRAYVVAAETGRLSVLDEAGQVIGGADLGEGAVILPMVKGMQT